jgi:hypothetical protein
MSDDYQYPPLAIRPEHCWSEKNRYPTKDLDTLGLSAEHLQAIGLVAVRWAELEWTLSEMIWDLASIGVSTGYAITAHLNERTRIDMLNSICDTTLGYTQLTHELHAHLKHIRDHIYPKRNKLLHSSWNFPHPKGYLLTTAVTARGKVKFSHDKFSLTDINQVVDEIFHAHERLNELAKDINQRLDELGRPRA